MFGKKQHYDRIISFLINLSRHQAIAGQQMHQTNPIDPDTPPFIKGALMQHEMSLGWSLLSLSKAIYVLKEGGTEEQAAEAYFQAMNKHMTEQWDNIKEGIHTGRLEIPL